MAFYTTISVQRNINLHRQGERVRQRSRPLNLFPAHSLPLRKKRSYNEESRKNRICRAIQYHCHQRQARSIYICRFLLFLSLYLKVSTLSTFRFAFVIEPLSWSATGFWLKCDFYSFFSFDFKFVCLFVRLFIYFFNFSSEFGEAETVL